VYITKFREIKSPVALATLGAFAVPEPLGTCFVLAAAIWWSCRKLKAIDLGRTLDKDDDLDGRDA
jgi:hypothetical protein